MDLLIFHTSLILSVAKTYLTKEDALCGNYINLRFLFSLRSDFLNSVLVQVCCLESDNSLIITYTKYAEDHRFIS